MLWLIEEQKHRIGLKVTVNVYLLLQVMLTGGVNSTVPGSLVKARIRPGLITLSV